MKRKLAVSSLLVLLLAPAPAAPRDDYPRRGGELNGRYLEAGALHVEQLGRGYAWFDTGTQESLLGAANFVEQVELRQGLKIACPEEVAYNLRRISGEQMRAAAERLKKSTYGAYIRQVAEEEPA
ncbi:MAG TPA: sugar phosphate nucleotidyltransferase [Thermoanaerobaculia bacterium]|jgi:glucose-1-phosphate thymidylyltransferase